MIEVIDYQEDNNIVSAGFKKYNFVVYGQTGVIEGFTKEQYLQRLYERCKSAIDYETILYEEGSQNSLVTEEEGEEFVPEEPKPIKLKIDFDNLIGEVLDQYGESYSTDGIKFTIEGTEKARIEGNKIIEDTVTEDTEYFVVAKWGGLEKRQKRVIYAPKPDKIVELENQVLEMQNYIVEKEYKELIKEGGM